MNELRLPEKHNMLLVLDGFLDLRGKEVTRLALLDLEKLTESTTAESLNDLIPLVEDLLTFFHNLLSYIIIMNKV